MAAISALMPAWVSSVVRFSGTDTRVDARTGVAQGHKVQLWKQDPSVKAIGIRSSYIHTPINKGPADDTIEIKGMPQVGPNADGDFMYDNVTHPKEFDAVHTFAVVRQVMTMFQRALKRMDVTDNFTWQWGSAPAKVYPHAGNTANAYYSRGQRSLKFFYFTPPGKSVNDRVYTTRSFDIVSHETGHAVLDGLKPGFLESWHPQTGGLHESFGDLSAIFTMLAQLDQCEAVIAESKTNLHDKTFFSAMAEEFGEALGRPMGLRNANNTLKLSDVSTEVHAISQVFTGAIYDVLSDMFEDSLKLDSEDPAATLFKTGEHLNALLLSALIKSPDRNATYKDVAQNMIDIETNVRWKDFILKRFTEREVFGTTKLAAAEPQKLDWSDTCGTLKRREHQKLFNEAIRNAKA